jgi:hypothetical protein
MIACSECTASFVNREEFKHHIRFQHLVEGHDYLLDYISCMEEKRWALEYRVKTLEGNRRALEDSKT